MFNFIRLAKTGLIIKDNFEINNKLIITDIGSFYTKDSVRCVANTAFVVVGKNIILYKNNYENNFNQAILRQKKAILMCFISVIISLFLIVKFDFSMFFCIVCLITLILFTLSLLNLKFLKQQIFVLKNKISV